MVMVFCIFSNDVAIATGIKKIFLHFWSDFSKLWYQYLNGIFFLGTIDETGDYWLSWWFVLFTGGLPGQVSALKQSQTQPSPSHRSPAPTPGMFSKSGSKFRTLEMMSILFTLRCEIVITKCMYVHIRKRREGIFHVMFSKQNSWFQYVEVFTIKDEVHSILGLRN